MPFMYMLKPPRRTSTSIPSPCEWLEAASRVQGAWLNRYGYLSDAKLDAVGRIWKGSA